MPEMLVLIHSLTLSPPSHLFSVVARVWALAEEYPSTAA